MSLCRDCVIFLPSWWELFTTYCVSYMSGILSADVKAVVVRWCVQFEPVGARRLVCEDLAEPCIQWGRLSRGASAQT